MGSGLRDSAQSLPVLEQWERKEMTDSFRTRFESLTGRKPFPWQTALFERFTSRDARGAANVPSVACLPTGLGKTSVIAVWLIALASGVRLPRRLVYVVNRRTVVDQTTREAERLKAAVESGVLPGLDCLAVSTLRGQFADNREWSSNPSRPAVICGTVDMVGSRLLFSGYGIGFRARPLHAGFLGQDALLVHDEAHLEPAFQTLITEIEREQQREQSRSGGLPWPPLRVMALSATARGAARNESSIFRLTDEETSVPDHLPRLPTQPIHHVWMRLRATKRLTFHSVAHERQELADKVATLALELKGGEDATVVFLSSVENALKVADMLLKRLRRSNLPEQVEVLTGTMRGHERDALLQQPTFARFLPDSDRMGVVPATGAAFLVCTSAGEVGVNLSADHMVSDLSTFDSMAQRLGRVNRFGSRADSQVHVVHPQWTEKEIEQQAAESFEGRRAVTLTLLQKLPNQGGGYDASPLGLDSLPLSEREAAFAPEPSIPRATDILFDAWAMTSVRGEMPGRPPVAPYLHGVAEWEAPRTTVAWREEVELFENEVLDERYNHEFWQSLLDDYPLKPHEVLSDISTRVHQELKRLFNRAGNRRLWLVNDQGQVEHVDLQTLVRLRKNDAELRLGNSTVLLPPSAGGLAKGLLNGRSPIAGDVADLWLDENQAPRRMRLWGDQQPDDKLALIRTIDTNPLGEEEELDEGTDGSVDKVPQAETRFWNWYCRPQEAENPTPASLLPVRLLHHSQDALEESKKLASALDLPVWLRNVIEFAAQLHDEGKKREIWQRSIGNPDPTTWFAKPGKPQNGPRWRSRHISEYRHEFGSILDLLEETHEQHGRLVSMPAEEQDLVLHLIAAHHGRARPHFTEDEVVDRNYSQARADEVAAESIRRFARLQCRFGRWSLAYLESLVRAADWAASSNPSSRVEGAEA